MATVIRAQSVIEPTPAPQARESFRDAAPLRPDETSTATHPRTFACRWTMAQTPSGLSMLTASWVETAAPEGVFRAD